MRGKDLEYPDEAHHARITPAHAGKRFVMFTAPYAYQDHPRTCGEKYQWKESTDTAIGSPPHMRGKVASVSMI